MEPMIVCTKKSQAFLGKKKGLTRSEVITFGKFFLRIEITAPQDTLYIPVSIDTGRKSVGFIYIIEGTAESDPSAQVSCTGSNVTIVTAGSISYCKIPSGKTAIFEVRANVMGTRGKKYRFIINRINYKLNPNDPRYKKFLTEIGTEFIKIH